jgi:hypothetical protein
MKATASSHPRMRQGNIGALALVWSAPERDLHKPVE